MNLGKIGWIIFWIRGLTALTLQHIVEVADCVRDIESFVLLRFSLVRAQHEFKSLAKVMDRRHIRG